MRSVIKFTSVGSCKLPIAHIVPPDLQTSVIEQWMLLRSAEPWHLDLCRWLLTDDLADRLFSKVTKIPDRSRDVSRHFSAADIDTMLQGPVEKSDSFAFSLPYFKVPKSCGEKARLVQDCRPFNEFFKSEFPELVKVYERVRLPHITDVVERVLAHAEKLVASQRSPLLVQFDAKAFFYQIGLPPRLRQLFGGRIGALRGSFINVRSRALPMGACFSPALAQLIAKEILLRVMKNLEGDGVLGDVYIDNFFFVADASLLQKIRNVFADTAREANLQYTEEPLDSTLLGISFVFGLSCIASIDLPPWRAPVSNRDFLARFGAIMWANNIGEKPLALFPELMRQVRDVCTHARWNDHFEGDTSYLQDLYVDTSSWRRTAFSASNPVKLWSDARPTVLAGMRDDLQWSFIFQIPQTPIHRAETAAAILCLLREHAEAGVLVDNTTAAAAIYRGHSSDPVLDLLIKVLYEERRYSSFIAWVPTAHQRADALTRGVPVTPLAKDFTLPIFRRTRWRKRGGEREARLD